MVSMDDIPLIRPGNTAGNICFGLLYIVLAPLWIPLAPLVVVGTDYNGWGQRLTSSVLGRLPGIAAAGWRSRIVLSNLQRLGSWG